MRVLIYRLFFLFSFAILLCDANAALTLRYCNLGLGTGSNNGTSEADAWQSLANMRDGYAVDQHIYVRNSSGSVWQEGAAITFAVSATALAPIWFEGYTTTPDDKGLVDLDMETNLLAFAGDNLLIEGFDVTAAHAADVTLSTTIGDGSTIYRCKVVNSNSGSGDTIAIQANDATVLNCYAEIFATGANAKAIYGNEGLIFGCRVKTTSDGIWAEHSFKAMSVVNCVIEGSGASGSKGILIDDFNNNVLAQYTGNTIWDFDDGMLLNEMQAISASAPVPLFSNNIIYNVDNGIRNLQTGVTEISISIINNFIGGATSSRYSGFGDLPLPGDVTLSADPFTNAAGGDFSLNNTAGGGALIRTLALPTKFSVDGSVDNFLDGGALQHEDAGGGGGDKWPYRGMKRIGY